MVLPKTVAPIPFQSTQPKRAATVLAVWQEAVLDISIHAAQEGCDHGDLHSLRSVGISIHAAQEGCDMNKIIISGRLVNFNPRSPRGLRQKLILYNIAGSIISIHAAQEGCDCSKNLQFNQLPSFQSTQPKRAATLLLCSHKLYT